MDVFRQRLEDEYDANVIITAPSVPYKSEFFPFGVTEFLMISVVYRDRVTMISNPTDFPDLSDSSNKVLEVQEPVVNASIIVPEGEYASLRTDRCLSKIATRKIIDRLTSYFSSEYFGPMMELCYARRAANLEHRYLDSASASARILLKCELPLSEIVSDFYSLLKGRSSGYASFECVLFPGPNYFRQR